MAQRYTEGCAKVKQKEQTNILILSAVLLFYILALPMICHDIARNTYKRQEK